MVEGGKIGMLVIAGPEDPQRDTWMEAVRHHLSRRSEVQLYLIDRGVLHLMDDALFGITSEKLRIFACAYGSRRYGVPLTKPVVFAGLAVLYNLVVGCQAFLSVSPFVERGEETRFPDSRRERTGRRESEGVDLVVHIRWNPRESHLAVEGLRIAAGMTIGNTALKICLNRQATPLLDLDAEAVVDGDRRDSYLDICKRRGVVFLHEGEREGKGIVESRFITSEDKEELLTGAYRVIAV